MAQASPLHLLLLLLLCLLVGTTAVADVPDSYALGYSPVHDNGPQEYLDPSYPAPRPNPAAPICTVPILSHAFADTYGQPPPKAAYVKPAECPAPWSLVVLVFSASCAGKQYDRVAAVWLDGVELLRTTTAEPTASGVRWTVRKDVTRFSGLLQSPPEGIFSVMLENIVNDNYTGVYHVNVSLEFYGAPAYVADHRPRPQVPKSYFQPANLIVPISAENCDNGYWVRIQNATDGLSKAVTVPSSTYRAVLEVFVSFHGNDEFWYSNPPDSYIKENNLTTRRGNAAYREVVVTVDRIFAGSFVPFPVIYSGGINPLFWQPVAPLGAFNLPSYDVELTPFLGLLLDGKPHDIGINIVDGISEWLVDANLHLWLDPSPVNVTAALGRYKTPRLKISRRYSSLVLDGSFVIRGKRKTFFSGWVSSSFGNFTTDVESKLELSSLVAFADDGTNKIVRMMTEQKTELLVRSDRRKVIAKQKVKAKYPLTIVTLTQKGENGIFTVKANLTHALKHETKGEYGEHEESSVEIENEQLAEGWMQAMDHEVLNGTATTSQSYRYEKNDAEYERDIGVLDSRILSDNITERYGDSDLASACCRGMNCNGVELAKCSTIAAIQEL